MHSTITQVGQTVNIKPHIVERYGEDGVRNLRSTRLFSSKSFKKNEATKEGIKNIIQYKKE